MVWALTTTKKKMPVDVDPNLAGNLILSQDTFAPELSVRIAEPADAGDGGPRFVSHFATCADAARKANAHEREQDRFQATARAV